MMSGIRSCPTYNDFNEWNVVGRAMCPTIDAASCRAQDRARPTFVRRHLTDPETKPAAARSHGLSRGLMAVLAVSVFATAGTIHYQTPALALIGTEFHANAAAVGWVATLSFAGFLAGTILLVPLGDRIDKRWLILGNVAALIISVLAMAAAPSVAVLAALSFVTGIGASVSQHIVPLVAELARPNERGRAVGTVLSGLFLGILFARVVGGLIASHLGWRWMYVISALMMLAVTPALVMRLPSTQPQTRLA